MHIAIFPTYCYAHAIRIRIRGNHNIRTATVCLLNSQGQSRGIFRIGRSYCRESAILHILSRNRLYIATQLLQERYDNMSARPMKIGVNDFSTALVEKLRTKQDRFQPIHINTVKRSIQYIQSSLLSFGQWFVFFRT